MAWGGRLFSAVAGGVSRSVGAARAAACWRARAGRGGSRCPSPTMSPRLALLGLQERRAMVVRRSIFTAQGADDAANDASSGRGPAPLTAEQKKILFISAAVPMVGFGFMDNMVMITMGEVIDSTMGVTFGLSTLTAAGFGQIFSDISGICFGGTVEAICTKLGLPTAKLTSAQAAMGQTKRTTTLGAVCGVTVGCLLGMSILLFKSDETEDRKHDAEFVKMLEADDKDELREYVAKIRQELAQAEAALIKTEAAIQGGKRKEATAELKRWRSQRSGEHVLPAGTDRTK